MIKEVKIVDKGKLLRIRDYGVFVRFVANGSEIEVNKKALVDWLAEENITYRDYIKRRNERYANIGKGTDKKKGKGNGNKS